MPHLGDRTLFPALGARAYLNHAAVSPPSAPVARAANDAIADLARRGADALPDLFAQRDRLRAQVATFLDVAPADIGFPPGTTRGIVDVALAIPWQKGDRILCFDGEFPANVGPWHTAERLGATVEMHALDGFDDGSGDGLARVEAALRRGGVRLVAVSEVQFQTGLRMPVQALAELAHAHGAELFVDAIQSLGAVETQARCADYVVAGTHKWLMGLEGAAVLYIAPAARERLRPLTAGWLSHQEGLRFLFEGAGLLRYDRPLRTDAAWVEGGVQGSAAFAALETSLAILTALGIDSIYAHIQRYHDLLEPGLVALGCRSARASDPAARSGSLSVRPPDTRPIAAWSSALAEHGVAVSTPDGWLRFAPHWPNALDEVPEVLAAMREVRG